MDSRSGGKIMTKRYRRRNTTPYDLAQPAPKDPNWLARVISPATRVIAGASKIISSVFDSDSSSSSSPESGGDASSENDDVGNEIHDNADGIYSLNEDHGNRDESCVAEQVEQLLMNGKFSRQECDRFIEIIKSRALDFGMEDSDKVRSEAVMEARKWLEQKKDESNPMMVDEFGSPADVAKHYLKSRSPWPPEQFGLQTPATMMTSPFQEGSSMAAAAAAAAGHEFSSLVKKRSSLASGSWNIQDEIRSVRAKATEDMLKSSSPSTRNPHARDTTINPISERQSAGKELNITSMIEETQTVLTVPAIPMLEKNDPKILGDNAVSFIDNDDSHLTGPKDSKTDDEIGKLEEETQVTLSAENVNGTIPNVTVATEYGSEFLSEASVEVPVMEDTDSMAANVSLMNSDNKLVVDEVPAKQEAKKPVRSSSRRGSGSRGGGRGRGRGRVKGQAR